MSHFHTALPNNIFFGFLEEVCLKTNKYYLFNNNSYRKMFYDNSNTIIYNEFKDILNCYYNEDKLFYIEREMTYNRFTSILRQICKTNKIKYESKVKYTNSEYCIELFIYF